MRVGINLQALAVGYRHGFSTYIGNLLRTLRAGYPEHEFVGLRCQEGPGWRLPNQLWWDQVRVPWRAWREHVDLLHVPAYSAPVVCPVPVVMTVMDLLYTRYPQWLPTNRARWYWGRWIPFTARRATAVIAPSEATKRDLVDLAGIPRDGITVISLTVAPQFLKMPSKEDIQAYRLRQGLDRPYILYLGVIDRRKDLGGLIRAYVHVRATVKDVRLVIAGHLIPGRSSLVEEINELKLGGDVLLPDHVPDEEVPLLYAGASLFVYPSWWEGFGLPPLEAMAQGVPVITYRTSSLPEVVGDAAMLIDPPFPVEALAAAMVQVLEDERLRSDLITRGHRRVSEFSWERAAEQTLAVYRRCVGAQHRT